MNLRRRRKKINFETPAKSTSTELCVFENAYLDITFYYVKKKLKFLNNVLLVLESVSYSMPDA